jgi:hypothetical protein
MHAGSNADAHTPRASGHIPAVAIAGVKSVAGRRQRCQRDNCPRLATAPALFG